MENNVLLDVHVKPASSGFELKGFNEWNSFIEVKCRSPALKGKANLELEKELSKIFGAEVNIVKGFSSRKKKVLIKNKSLEEIKGIIRQKTKQN
ncbi:MAG: DUF167 family protein [Candidatus Diapherotrites archaeon]